MSRKCCSHSRKLCKLLLQPNIAFFNISQQVSYKYLTTYCMTTYSLKGRGGRSEPDLYGILFWEVPGTPININAYPNYPNHTTTRGGSRFNMNARNIAVPNEHLRRTLNSTY